MNLTYLLLLVVVVQITGNILFRLQVKRKFTELEMEIDAIVDEYSIKDTNTPVTEAPENEDITNSLSQRIGSLEISNRTLVRTIRREITKALKPRRG